MRRLKRALDYKLRIKLFTTVDENKKLIRLTENVVQLTDNFERLVKNTVTPTDSTVGLRILKGQGQTTNFTCAQSNANDKIILLFYLICIRFGTCEVRRLTRA